MRNSEVTERLEKLYNRVLVVTGIDIKNEKSRLQDVVYAKKIFYYCARKKMFTFHQIADFLKCNHATVIHHCRDTPYLLKQDPAFMTNYLRVQGQPIEGKSSRLYFDLMIGSI
jgi:chromosomal replication initiation ATPase DnaA